MEDYTKLFDTYLNSRKMKLTASRRLILEAVFSLHEHFDAEQLHQVLRSASQDISLATVYRTLPLLLQAGLIQPSPRPGTRGMYEHIWGHPRHAHWVCVRCGAVQETPLDSVDPILAREARNLKFETQETSVEVKGLCWKCQNSANDSQ
ncbi:MAG TPA: Fur family transcriptional regulator [Candidatus Cloacimonadota bacterium]|nr:Fur family transcriptional regulator [Candidatus Cloacimonadota bacterium]HPX67628.1 Fur family transcriptional regulator [Candidatus Syntrophosphaera sp.]HOR59606.1 Fur family transcriptional regulator [Candidatus Cloacimonadota bacterium]HPB09550.1 Fur family transcriptional regulator [Candidatus Cloacimonadota bacterium]HPL23872.1 Fur family transcriptional regulator [Candidatus Cloacimonadota bacterium]